MFLYLSFVDTSHGNQNPTRICTYICIYYVHAYIHVCMCQSVYTQSLSISCYCYSYKFVWQMIFVLLAKNKAYSGIVKRELLIIEMKRMSSTHESWKSLKLLRFFILSFYCFPYKPFNLDLHYALCSRFLKRYFRKL